MYQKIEISNNKTVYIFPMRHATSYAQVAEKTESFAVIAPRVDVVKMLVPDNASEFASYHVEKQLRYSIAVLANQGQTYESILQSSLVLQNFIAD